MKITLFMPCIVDNLLPEVGEAVVAVLARLGADLEYPVEQTCCGQPAFNGGHWEDARRVAKNFLRVFEHSENIVCPSGSCVSMVRKHYEELFADSPRDLELARAIGGRTFEFSEFLAGGLGATEVGASCSGKVVYHQSCHLTRELGVKDQPLQLLRAVKGLELVEMEEADRCCGFGGTFSVKFPEVSAAMARRKFERIRESGADTVVLCDPGCLIQFRGYASRNDIPVSVLHLAELLNRSRQT